jgi:Fe-S-cluster containining protein
MSSVPTPSLPTQAAPTSLLEFAPFATANLRIFVIRSRDTLSIEAFESLLAEIRIAYEAHLSALRAASAGAGRARVFHRRMDDEIESATQWKPTCHKGCSGCCHCEVEVTTDEAELLAELLRAGLEIDRARLARQATRPRKSLAWVVPLSRESRCVMLGTDGDCRVYEDRPSICRKHLVVNSPDACVTLGAQTSPIQVPRAEILLSAALAIAGASFTSLPKALVARI